MHMLVGYTGFVGSNLYEQHTFSGVYNSKNIHDAYDSNPDLCVYAGVRAEKFLANSDPKADMAVIEEAIENIKRINPKRLALISTIDVYKNSCGCDERTAIDENGLHPYGYNRYALEKWCAGNIANCNIIRLPGLFGKNIKKNFIYDLINILPSALNESKFAELSVQEVIIKNNYIKQDNGFYKLKIITEQERAELLKAFERLNFSALNFTDSRAVFQFYNLVYLWNHIEFTIKNNIKLLNISVEPVSARDIYKTVHDGEFVNEITANPPRYDFKSIYAGKLSGSNGYIFDRQKVLEEIKKFVIGEKGRKAF